MKVAPLWVRGLKHGRKSIGNDGQIVAPLWVRGLKHI